MASFFSAFLTVFRFPAGRYSRVIKQNLKARILVALTVFCAVLFRVLGRTTPYPMLFGIMRTMTYIGLYIGWGISVSKRVIQEQVRHYLVSVSGLMVFWFVIRSI